MKRGLLRRIAGISAILLVGAITLSSSRAERREGRKTLPYNSRSIPASERPAYGGTLRAQLGGPVSLPDPAAGEVDASEAELVSLVYETLVRINGRGDVQPLLAET